MQKKYLYALRPNRPSGTMFVIYRADNFTGEISIVTYVRNPKKADVEMAYHSMKETGAIIYVMCTRKEMNSVQVGETYGIPIYDFDHLYKKLFDVLQNATSTLFAY